MTEAEISDVIFDTWTNDRPRSGLSDFGDHPAAEGMVRSQCDAIARAVVQAVIIGVQSAPVWKSQRFTSHSATHTLNQLPISGSLLLFRNGQLEIGWTLAATTITLATALAGTDGIDAWYQV